MALTARREARAAIPELQRLMLLEDDADYVDQRFVEIRLELLGRINELAADIKRQNRLLWGILVSLLAATLSFSVMAIAFASIGK